MNEIIICDQAINTRNHNINSLYMINTLYTINTEQIRSNNIKKSSLTEFVQQNTAESYALVTLLRGWL